VTSDTSIASDWFRRFEGAGLDGVMVKAKTGTYEPDKRVMLKVKHERDCDCVVAGFRWHKNGEGTAIGSLLLGLFDDQGTLQHVGVCASFTMEKRRELVKYLATYREDALTDHPWKTWSDADSTSGAEHRMPGGQSRWSQGKDLSWEPLRPELVVEVAYEHMQGSRFRHMAHFRRWRTDKRPSDCTYAQLEVVPPQELMAIFAGSR
jgi:ATP-dependent DNA ligase